MIDTLDETAEAAGMLARRRAALGLGVVKWGSSFSPIGGLDMHRINVGWWYYLAQKLGEASRIDLATKNFIDAWYFWEADALLAELEGSKILEITTSRSACQGLRSAFQEARELVRLHAGENSPDLEMERSRVGSRIHVALQTLEKVLQEELKIADVYAVGQKRIYSTHMLIERAEEALGSEARSIVSEQVRKDLREAGRSLAFELPTAAGFHAMRATEKVSREWYEELSGKNSGRVGWKKILDHIEEAGGDQATSAALDRVRDLHRNPLLHPEQFLSLDEALELFGAAETAINAVARQLKLTRAAKAPAQSNAPSPPSGQSPGGAQS